MDSWQAAILGIVQGATEFLPVSSSGHLVILPLLFDWPDQGLFFDVVVHFGTLLAIVTYFWSDVRELITRFFSDCKKIWQTYRLQGQVNIITDSQWQKIIVATLPIALLGFLIKDQIETQYRTLLWVGFFFSVVSFSIFFFSRKLSSDPGPTEEKDLTFKKAFLIGMVQALALFPGVSRSGVTILMGLWLGLRPTQAAKFSFLLSIPAVLGAVLLTGLEILGQPLDFEWWVYLVGFLSASISGYLAISFMLGFLKKYSLRPFAVYLLLVSIVILFMEG